MHNFSALARSLESKATSTKRKAIIFFIIPAIFIALWIAVVLLYQFRFGNKSDTKHSIFYLIQIFAKSSSFDDFKETFNALKMEVKIYLGLLLLLSVSILIMGFVLPIVLMISISGLKEINRKISSIPILSLDTQALAKSATSNLGAANVLIGFGFIIPILTFIGVILALVGSSKTKAVSQDILWNLQVNQLAQNANNSNGVYY